MPTFTKPARTATVLAAAAATVAVACAIGSVTFGGAAGSPSPEGVLGPARTTQAVAASATPAPASAAQRRGTARPTSTGCVIVKYAKGVKPTDSGTDLGNGTVLRPVPPGKTAEQFAEELAASGAIEFAEPDYLLAPAEIAYTSTPNDGAFNDPAALVFGGTSVPYAKAWGLRGTFSPHFDQVWPALAHAKASSSEVHVAVLDTGFYSRHPDAAQSNITPAVDECSLYYPSSGRLTTDSDVSPVPYTTILEQDPRTVAAHGTMTASEIGAAADNYLGSLGAAYDTQVDIYKVQGIVAENANGLIAGTAYIPESALINAVNDAVAASKAGGYRLVINVSLVLVGPDPAKLTALKNTLAAARNAGVIVVAASGNDGISSVYYPAALSGVLGVGASTVSAGALTRASYSNYGTALDLMAPGTNIWGATDPGIWLDSDPAHIGYAYWTGTSMAAPYVASAAALLLRVEPSLTATEVVNYLQGTATDIGTAGWDTRTGWGELDMLAAYRQLVTPRTTATVLPRYSLEANIDFTVTDRDSGPDVTTYYRIDGSAPLSGSSVTVSSIGQHTIEYWSVDSNGATEAAHSATFEVLLADSAPPDTTSNAVGAYRGTASISLSATDGVGGWGVAQTFTILDGGSPRAGLRVSTGRLGMHSVSFWSTDLAGNAEAAHTVTFTVSALAPTVTLSRSASTISHGSRIRLSGYLAPARVGDTVRIQVRYPGSHTWRYFTGYSKYYKRSVTTVNSLGRGTWSSLSYPLTRHGRYYFRVYFAGDSTYISRTARYSSTVSVYVR